MTSSLSRQLLVFTDLDGCLLDHFSYSYEPARPALIELKSRKIPLILSSSKTLAELADLSAELNLSTPFIVENGAGVILPDGYFTAPVGDLESNEGLLLKTFGAGLLDVVRILHELRDEYGFMFSGFSDMTSTEVADLTGLSIAGAEKARQRLFTEPLLWQDSDQNWLIFSQRLNDAGLSFLRGGRFIHITGGGDKGMALDWLRGCYEKETGSLPLVMALGDSDNDVAMLAKADYPVVVRSPVHQPPVIEGRAGIIFTEKTGPAGWNDAVLDRLRLFEKNGTGK